VLDLVRLGAAPRTPTRFAGLDSIWRGAAERARDARLRERVLAPLQLLPYAEQPVQTLSYGLRKTVDLARALAGEPRLLLLDEPVAGLTRHEARAMADTILAVRAATGCAVLLVEHKMDVVLRLCDRVVVMAAGRCIFEGPPAELQSDAEVRRVYLGEAA
jgi:branched-chain amino acid transport system ATP-binding protein